MINIQELQIKNKEAEIVNNELLNGNFVTTHDVFTKMNEFFTNHTPGLPYYRNLRIKPHSKSDKEVYNKSFKTLENDLDIAYSIYNMQEIAILDAKSSFDSEILQLYKEFDEINSEIELATRFSNDGLVYYPYTINFNNLKDVNTKNLNKQNIPKTTCEIDYDKSLMRNEMLSTPNDKIDLSNAKISIKSSSKVLKINGDDIKSIINENQVDVINILTTSNSESYHSIEIDVSLESEREMSKISISGFNMSNAYATLLISDNDKDYIEREINDGGRYTDWVFNKRLVKSFKIIIKKSDFDIKEKNSNSCIFSISNISAYNDKYSPSSVFTSSIVRFDDPITSVMIEPSHSMPPNTDISYFIGYENKFDNVEWHPIKPGEFLNLNLLYSEEDILNYNTPSNSGSQNVFGRWDFERGGDETKRLYYISELVDRTNLNSIEVRAGHSQWIIERLDVTEKYGTPYPKNKKVEINDYSKKYIKAIGPLDMNMTELRCEKEWNYFVMSSYVICSKETIVEDKFFNYEFTKDSDGNNKEILDIVVIINGRKIFPKDGKYSFRLKEGENLVRIMILFGNQDISNIGKEDGLKFISHNFNLLGVSDRVFAGPKMQRVSYSHLGNHAHEFDLKHFAIKTVDNTEYIVTKVDPNYILNPYDPYASDSLSLDDGDGTGSGGVGQGPIYNPPNIYINNSEYLRMYVKYKHMPLHSLENILNENGDGSIRLRLMARLTSSDISVSPSITKIKVVGI